MRLRGRTDADLPVCAELLRAVHERDGYPLDRPADPAAWLTPPSLRSAWVAERDGTVVGHAALCLPGADDVAPGRFGDDGLARTAVVNRLFVSPAARGLGVGAALLGRLTEEAAAAGLHPVLDVVATDTAAVALYERLGWRHLGDAVRWWGPDRAVTLRCYAAPPSRRFPARPVRGVRVRHVKQNCAPQFADIEVDFEPAAEGFVFETGPGLTVAYEPADDLPRFFAAAAAGIEEQLNLPEHAVVVAARVVLRRAQAHAFGSHERAFRFAGHLAAREALRRAGHAVP
ncbi:GNAT family N-acetyltransferase [Streptomyces sp. MJP52]|uniref:GNAT family N-acetyltransferase n=1 Tax=Streptomyces sp. MJP52 TaxID=2940555 RepID=UPI0032B019C7